MRIRLERLGQLLREIPLQRTLAASFLGARTVFTGQMNVLPVAGKIAFETRDFYLACFLRCSGYELIDLRPDGRRKVFVFRDRPARHEVVLAYYRDDAAVPALAFSSTIKDMKALLHNA